MINEAVSLPNIIGVQPSQRWYSKSIMVRNWRQGPERLKAKYQHNIRIRRLNFTSASGPTHCTPQLYRLIEIRHHVLTIAVSWFILSSVWIKKEHYRVLLVTCLVMEKSWLGVDHVFAPKALGLVRLLSASSSTYEGKTNDPLSHVSQDSLSLSLYLWHAYTHTYAHKPGFSPDCVTMLTLSIIDVGTVKWV